MSQFQLISWDSEYTTSIDKNIPDEICLIWNDKVPSFDKKKPYLWKRERLTFSDGTIKHSEPSFLGDYSPKTFKERLYNFIYKHSLCS